MELLTSLVFKCYKNDLQIEITPHISGLVQVWHWELHGDGKARGYTTVTQGYTKNWKHETPEATLKRMHQEVDKFLNDLYMVDDVSFDGEETEHAQARLTEYERKMKEANVKEIDFL